MYVVVIAGARGAGLLRELDDDGNPAGPVREVAELAGAVAELERAHRPRWVWPSTAEVYPALLAAGVRVDRCHEPAAVEALLLGHAGRHGEPRGLAAAYARLRGLPVPADRPARAPEQQQGLFDADAAELPGGADPVTATSAVLADQLRRLAGADGGVRLLAAAESAGTLAAAEMTHFGLPWRADVHAELLTAALGPRPAAGAHPAKLVELGNRITAAFDGREVNPDRPATVLRAFARDGVQLSSTRAWELRRVEHPAVAPLLAYKELYRLWVAHGWSWIDTWIHDGRFRPEYVVGGVVSGRWATRGGAALGFPKTLRAAVLADEGYTLVVADAAQLEPRVLAALSGDRRLAEVSARGDLYAGLAADAFAGDRARAKVAMLSAMYGGTGGEAGQLLAVLRQRFPVAVGHVEQAARAGAAGSTVLSRLGRRSPPPSAGWRELAAEAARNEADERRAAQAARDWGRFTRNFVVQASAADWALSMLATLRLRLRHQVPAAQIVFFQHDEVIVHCADADVARVREHLQAAAVEASELVFAGSGVVFPLEINDVRCYADAK